MARFRCHSQDETFQPSIFLYRTKTGRYLTVVRPTNGPVLVVTLCKGKSGLNMGY